MRLQCTEELHHHGGPGRFLLARAEDVLTELVREYGGTVQMIYLDPPFGTGDTFHIRVAKGKKSISLPAFTDTLPEKEYLTWMRLILVGCHALLCDTGCLYLHIDYRMSAQLRLMLDDIFGKSNFMNEIIWCYRSGGRSTRYFPRKHDNILFYRKSKNVYFHIAAVGKPRGAQKRNHMKRFIDDDGRICFSIRSGGKVYTYYEDTPMYPSDVWSDIEHLQQKDRERVGYATQKPEALLERMILASSKEDDLILDLFSGSGTTAATAARLKRRFLTVDASPFALYTLRARLLQSGGEPSLLEDTYALRLSYPPTDDEAKLDYTLVRCGNAWQLCIDGASFEKGFPIIYHAVGTSEGGVFYPVVTDARPDYPKKLRIKTDTAPVLQIVDSLGRQAFYTLEETR